MVSCCFEALDVSISLRRNVMVAYERERERRDREEKREETDRGERVAMGQMRGLISIRSVRRQR